MIMRKVKNYLSNKLLQSTGWQIGAQIYTMFFSLIVGSVTARYLGPENYGLIGYGQSIVALFNTVATLGMGEVIVNDLVNKPEERAAIIGSAIFMRFLSSLTCIVIIDVCVSLLEPDNVLLKIITLLQSIALLLQSCDILTYWFQANMKFKYPAIGSMVATTLVSLWRISLLIRGTSVEWFAFSSCIQYLASGFVVFFIFFHQNNIKLVIEFKTMRSIFRRSYHFVLSNLAIALYTQMDKIMLGKMLGEEKVGLYSAAGTIAGLWEFIPMAIINSAKVIIYKNFHKKDLYQLQQALLFVGITMLSFLAGAGVLIFGKFAILFLYGKKYIESVAALNILIWATGFAMIGTARGSTWIILNDMNKYVKYYVVIASAVNIILNYALIPHYDIVGAAFATLVSQITASFIAPFIIPKTRSFISVYLKSWKISFAYMQRKMTQKNNDLL